MGTQNVITQSSDGPLCSALESLILVVAKGKTVTLPDARRHAGLPMTIKNTAAGSQTTVATLAGQLIDGAVTYKLTPALACVRVVSDGSGWWVTGRAP